MRDTDNKNLKREMLIQTVMLHVGLKIAAVPPTQPLSRYITMRQKHLNASSVEVWKKVWESGILKGTGISCFSEGNKTLYKSPILLSAQQLTSYGLEAYAPAGWHQNKLLVNCIAGFLVGTSEAVISLVPDRIATFLKASDLGDQSFSTYLKNSRGFLDIWQKLTNGFTVYAFKQSLMVSTLYISQHEASTTATVLFPEDKKSQVLFTTFTSPLLPAIVGSPFDVIKTWQQKPGADKQSMLRTSTTLLTEHGLKAFSAGLGGRIALMYIGYSINAFILTLYKNAVQESPSTPH